jgi:threonine dehydrogenase-like Zn-dependent dehydrogenase
VHHKVGADTLTSQEPETGQALICGGGPCGLVAAITLHQLGWQDIVLVERRPSHAAFERGKAFNYQIDGRGQGHWRQSVLVSTPCSSTALRTGNLLPST